MHMDKRIPVPIKLHPKQVERLDKFKEGLPFPTTRTALIEAAIDQFLDREEKKVGRK